MRKIKILVFLFLVCICFLAYFNSLSNPFIWDDQALVVNNALIRSAGNLGSAFANDLYFGVASGSNFYRPVQTLSYIFDYHFWQLNPFGYHLTNIVLQIAVGFAVFLLIFTLLNNLPVSIAAAALFTVNPLHTESVTYISGRAEMLMGFFVILALLFFIRSKDESKSNGALFYGLSLFSFVLGILSKEVAFVFPFAIGGYIFYFLRDKLKDRFYLIKNLAPFLAISIIYLVLRLSYINFATLRVPSLANVPWYVRLSLLPKIVLTYFKLLILPLDLHMNRELVRPTTVVGICLAIISLGALIFIVWNYLKYRPQRKAASFLLFCSLVFFIPQSGIFPINAFVAEHFIYLSSISFFVCLAYLLHKFLRFKPFVLILGLICLFYILLIYSRNLEWKSPLIFYQKIIRYSPGSFQGHNNLGLQYEYAGDFDAAENEYKQALKIKPDLLEARSNLANLYFKLKLYDRALAEYALIEKSPLGSKAGEVANNLGNVYESMGNFKLAVLKYNQALKLDPGLKYTHFNLARLAFADKKIDLAVEHISASLGFSSQKDAARDQILADFLKSVVMVNNAAEFYNNLGINFARFNRWPEAIRAFDCALELDQRSADYYYNLGLAYYHLGQRSKVRGALKQALKINPNHIRAKRLIALN